MEKIHLHKLEYKLNIRLRLKQTEHMGKQESFCEKSTLSKCDGEW